MPNLVKTKTNLRIKNHHVKGQIMSTTRKSTTTTIKTMVRTGPSLGLRSTTLTMKMGTATNLNKVNMGKSIIHMGIPTTTAGNLMTTMTMICGEAMGARRTAVNADCPYALYDGVYRRIRDGKHVETLGMGMFKRMIIGSIASGGLALLSALISPWYGPIVMPPAIA
jgi:hypothetical protein